MPRPRYRSRSLRRRSKKSPGGRRVIHYEKRNKNWPKCAVCGKPLLGVPRDPKDVSKSSKRPERPYGGYLCAECLRRELIIAVVNRYAPNMKEKMSGV